LHLVDLDGAREGAVKNWKVLEKIAGKTKLLIDFSGGISSIKSVDICFNSGASWAAVGSIAVKDETAFTGWLLAYGPEKFMIGGCKMNRSLSGVGQKPFPSRYLT
jgi:phosphoribosylformimino-5-aminoimidazole carboxamide ribotide isomerase